MGGSSFVATVYSSHPKIWPGKETSQDFKRAVQSIKTYTSWLMVLGV
jgi:hypothetical protein